MPAADLVRLAMARVSLRVNEKSVVSWSTRTGSATAAKRAPVAWK
jgi:hypothetical protein